MDVDDENRDGFDMPSDVPSNVGQETHNVAQQHVDEIDEIDEILNQGMDSGFYVDATMDMVDQNSDVFDTLTVGQETQSLDQAHVGEVLKPDEWRGMESGFYVDATMDMEDQNHDVFDTPTVVASDVGEETQSLDQAHVGEILKHGDRQGMEIGCLEDVTMDMEDKIRDGFDTPVLPLDVGEEKQRFAQPHVDEICKHDEPQLRESGSSMDAMVQMEMDMEDENHEGIDTRTIVPSDIREEKQSRTQAHTGEIIKNDERLGKESSCSEDVKILKERSESEEEDNSSLNLGMEKATQLVEYSETVDCSEDEKYLSDKYPFFNVVLATSHVKRLYELNIPDNFLPELPHVTVPVVIRCGGKNWNMLCIKNGEKRMFCSKWRKFVNSNNLKIGDACVFELRDFRETKMKFKVILLRNDLPPELQGKMQSVGGTEEKPIEFD